MTHLTDDRLYNIDPVHHGAMYQIKFWHGGSWVDYFSFRYADDRETAEFIASSYDNCAVEVNQCACVEGYPVADVRNWKIIGPPPEAIPSWSGCIHEEVETQDPPQLNPADAFFSPNRVTLF